MIACWRMLLHQLLCSRRAASEGHVICHPPCSMLACCEHIADAHIDCKQ